MTDDQLTIRTAFVTGASHGIGEAIARAFHSQGHKVALLARNPDPLQALADDLGTGALAVPGDVTESASLRHAIDHAERELGPIDNLVNNAGGVQSADGRSFRPFEDVPDEDWRGTWELNVLSTARTARILAPRMAARGWGRIINVSSESGTQPDPIGIEYASAKGALNLLSKGLSKAYAAQGILVNVVSPAYVDIPILRDMLAKQDGAEGVAREDLAQRFLSSFRPTSPSADPASRKMLRQRSCSLPPTVPALSPDLNYALMADRSARSDGSGLACRLVR